MVSIGHTSHPSLPHCPAGTVLYFEVLERERERERERPCFSVSGKVVCCGVSEREHGCVSGKVVRERAWMCFREGDVRESMAVFQGRWCVVV